MLNIHYKKPTTEVYDTQNVVQIIEAPCNNTESKCNFCDGKIYWNPAVIHRRTRKRLPLSEPYMGHGTNPKAHRGCKYNTDNFYKNLVIIDTDSNYVKATKRNQQRKLLGVDESGLVLVERLILARTPVEIEHYNEFIKNSTVQSFTGKK